MKSDVHAKTQRRKEARRNDAGFWGYFALKNGSFLFRFLPCFPRVRWLMPRRLTTENTENTEKKLNKKSRDP
ncbi:MAG: hypothetical protein DMF63_07590 [Acidobacteria bacterium]|nr:MAG: hypothetical protein DMF63_07590 [Acidobacteriota bacterium]